LSLLVLAGNVAYVSARLGFLHKPKQVGEYDHYRYIEMARGPEGRPEVAGQPPYCWRILIPGLARGLQSIGIAGAWGYIGSKFLTAARELGLARAVYDPGAPPAGLALDGIQQFTDEQQFYASSADLFHLALLPNMRGRALAKLLARPDQNSVAILNEKPMAAPEQPEHCQKVIDTVNSSGALMLFDFLELFSPMTEAIVAHLAQFRDVRIDTIDMQRSKDREAVENLVALRIHLPHLRFLFAGRLRRPPSAGP
jgi:hypothetical protein